MNKRECRFLAAKELRIAANADGGKTLAGYAAIYDSLSEDLGGWREKIAPGAFTRTLAANPDVMCLSDHDVKKGILGRTKSGTLRLAEDPTGLRFECDLPDTMLGRDIAESVGRGDVDGCSFGFVAQDASWDKSNGEVTRTLLDRDLFDVTVTAMPAYPATSVHLRSRLFPEGAPDVPEFREAKTKRVDGEDLPASAFLIVGDPQDTGTWKLPVHFSTDEKTKSHLRNALSRFNQLKGVSEEEKAKAWSKLVSLCKSHGIEVNAERSADNAEPIGCQCDCDACMDGDCKACTDPECNDEECRCETSQEHQMRAIDQLMARLLGEMIQ